MLIRSVDNSIEKRVNMINDSIKTQKGLDRLWNRIEIKMLKCNRDKCKILYLGWQKKKKSFTTQGWDGRKQLGKIHKWGAGDFVDYHRDGSEEAAHKAKTSENGEVEGGWVGRSSLGFPHVGQCVRLPRWNISRGTLINWSSTRGSSQGESTSWLC